MRKTFPTVNPELVEELSNHSEKAFRQIFDLLGDKVYNYCKKIVPNQQEAEELLQDIFFKIWEFREKIDAHENFEVLLFTIARNHLLNHIRKKAKLPVTTTDISASSESLSSEISDPLGFRETYQEYRRVLENLESRTREIFQLSRDHDLTNKQIAEKYFISTKAVEGKGQYRLYDTTGPQVKWVKRDLAANKNKGWVIAYWHHPPYSMGSHNSDTESELVHIRENFIRILERLGVDLVICGHSHNYERSRLMNGYYGKNADFREAAYDLSQSSGWYDGTPNSCPYIKDDDMSRGTVYVVTGSAGQEGGVQAAYPHKALPYSNSLTAGAAILEIKANRLDFKWINEDGKIGDHFTMMKKVNKDQVINAKKGQQVTLTASFEGDYRWTHSESRDKSIRVMASPGTTIYEVHDPFECIKERFVVKVVE